MSSCPRKRFLKVLWWGINEDSAWEGAPSQIPNFVAQIKGGLPGFVDVTGQLRLMDLKIEPLETL